MHYINLLSKQEKTKGFIRTVIVEWEPNSGKHQCGLDEGINCRLEAKGSMLPAMLHVQYQGSADSWRDGLQGRQQIRCSSCWDFQKLQAIASQENILVQLLTFALQNDLAKHRLATQDVHPLNLESSGSHIALLFLYRLDPFIPICCPCVFESTDVIRLSFARTLDKDRKSVV